MKSIVYKSIYLKRSHGYGYNLGILKGTVDLSCRQNVSRNISISIFHIEAELVRNILATFHFNSK